MTSRFALRSVFAVIAISAVFPAFARADVVPPAGDCEKKTAGDACTDYEGKAGACGTITYTRTFTPPTPGAQPEVSTRSYFGCKTGEAPKNAGKSCSVRAVGDDTDAGIGFVMLAFGAIALVRRRS